MLHPSKHVATSRLISLGAVYLSLHIILFALTSLAEGFLSAKLVSFLFLPTIVGAIGLSWFLAWYTDKHVILVRYEWISLCILLPSLILSVGGIGDRQFPVFALWTLVLWTLLGSYQDRERPQSFLLIGVALGVVYLFAPFLWTLAPIILLLTIAVYSLSFRHILAFAIGLLTPLLTILPFVPWSWARELWLHSYSSYLPLGSGYTHISEWVVLGILGVALLISYFVILSHYYRENTRVRNLLYFFSATSLLLLVNALFLSPDLRQYFILLSLPTLSIAMVKSGSYFGGRIYRIYLAIVLLIPLSLVFLYQYRLFL